jgi:DNA-binding response OmpR family regulator
LRRPANRPGREETGLSRKILIVEDSRTQAAYLQMLLESEGYEVEMATDGEEAHKRALASRPELVMADVVMPGMSGFELCRLLKSQPETRHIKVVLVTALNSAQDLLRGLECGADNFIRKPYDENYLLSRVRRILGAGGAEGAVHRVRLEVGGHTWDLSADNTQILELLLATIEDLSRANERLKEANLRLQAEGQSAETYSQGLEQMLARANEALERSRLASARLRQGLRAIMRGARVLGDKTLDDEGRRANEEILAEARGCLETLVPVLEARI